MSNKFIPKAYAVVQQNGYDTKKMSKDEVVDKFNEITKNDATPKEKERMQELGIEDKPKIVKGIIFKSNDDIKANKFTDFMDKGFSKLDDGVYLYHWTSGKPHQEVEKEIGDKYEISEPEAFATSSIGNKLDTYDFNRLEKYSKYKNEFIDKGKKLFEVRDTTE